MGRTEAALNLMFDRVNADTLEISATGPLDETTVAELRTQHLGRGDTAPDRILIDLSRLERIDAAGLAALLLARIEIEARGGAIAVFSTASRISKTIERAGLRRFVDVAGTRSAALRMLDRAA